jgi:hypothetical protein
MFRQISAPNPLNPPQQRVFSVLDTEVGDGIGRVIQTFPTKAPHGDREVKAALRQAFVCESEAKKRGIHTRVESLKHGCCTWDAYRSAHGS